jgi:hypothetical protein
MDINNNKNSKVTNNHLRQIVLSSSDESRGSDCVTEIVVCGTEKSNRSNKRPLSSSSSLSLTRRAHTNTKRPLSLSSSQSSSSSNNKSNKRQVPEVRKRPRVGIGTTTRTRSFESDQYQSDASSVETAELARRILSGMPSSMASIATSADRTRSNHSDVAHAKTLVRTPRVSDSQIAKPAAACPVGVRPRDCSATVAANTTPVAPFAHGACPVATNALLSAMETTDWDLLDVHEDDDEEGSVDTVELTRRITGRGQPKSPPAVAHSPMALPLAQSIPHDEFHLLQDDASSSSSSSSSSSDQEDKKDADTRGPRRESARSALVGRAAPPQRQGALAELSSTPGLPHAPSAGIHRTEPPQGMGSHTRGGNVVSGSFNSANQRNGDRGPACPLGQQYQGPSSQQPCESL